MLLEALGGLLALTVIAERGCLLGVGSVEFFGQLFLIFVQPPRLVAHPGQVLGEAIGRALAQLVAKFIELAAGARALGECLRKPALLEGFRCLADVFATLLELLTRIGHAIAVFFSFHPLAHLVGVAEDLLFLFAQPLELPLDVWRGSARPWRPRERTEAP